MVEPMTEQELAELRAYLETLSLGSGGFAYETDNRTARLLATLDRAREMTGTAIQCIEHFRPLLAAARDWAQARRLDVPQPKNPQAERLRTAEALLAALHGLGPYLDELRAVERAERSETSTPEGSQ